MPARPGTTDQRWRALRGPAPLDARLERAQRAADPVQARADVLRKTSRWQRIRAYVLRGNPLCQECRAHGRVEPATQVDHVVPVLELLRANDEERVFDPANLRALCRPCHARKSASERRARPPAAGGVGPQPAG